MEIVFAVSSIASFSRELLLALIKHYDVSVLVLRAAARANNMR